MRTTTLTATTLSLAEEATGVGHPQPNPPERGSGQAEDVLWIGRMRREVKEAL